MRSNRLDPNRNRYQSLQGETKKCGLTHLIPTATETVTGVTRAIFSDIVMENFTALSLDDREVELKPGGKNMPVTWDNRLE